MAAKKEERIWLFEAVYFDGVDDRNKRELMIEINRNGCMSDMDCWMCALRKAFLARGKKESLLDFDIAMWS